jgi:Tetratricopeptide repeat/Mitochondrial biogenesis AIM24
VSTLAEVPPEQQQPRAESPDALPGASERAAEAVTRHLQRARELIGARRFPEGELELSRALTVVPDDLRALKLLALVRFKLGRLADARQAYLSARQVAPQDAAVRLNLGLIALRLEWYDEAVTELEAVTRLGGGDARTWSYLGHAYARTGATGRAALAFRRSGQAEVAPELEQGRPRIADPMASPGTSDDPAPHSAVDFAVAHLVPTERAGNGRDDPLPFAVDREAHARQTALLATAGDLAAVPARRRRQGQLTDTPLGAPGDPFVRCRGTGQLWLTSPARGRGLVPLTLEEDVLYLREERVVAFDGEVVWEAGRIPGGGPALLQFRGSGRVVVDAGPGEVVALRVPQDELISVAPERLLGWMGRVVAEGVRHPQGGACLRVACEGEGVLLLSR